MRVFKYPQSCLLIEKNSHRILIDPGNLVTPKYKFSEFGKVDAVLYTHQHADHFDRALLKDILAADTPIFANSDVIAQIEGGKTNAVSHDTNFEVAGFSIKPWELAHAVLDFGQAGPPNTGFIFDESFFHSGDGIDTDGLKILSAAIPIIGPSFSFYQSINFAKKLGLSKMIPLHYEGTYKADPNVLKERFKEVEVMPLKDGESVEL